MNYDLRDYMQLQEGDTVECIAVWKQAEKSLTKGKNYEVMLISTPNQDYKHNWKFCIIDDQGKKRWYGSSNTMFRPFNKLHGKAIGLDNMNPSDLWVLRQTAQSMKNSPGYAHILLSDMDNYNKVEYHELEHFEGEVTAALMRKVYKLIK